MQAQFAGSRNPFRRQNWQIYSNFSTKLGELTLCSEINELRIETKDYFTYMQYRTFLILIKLLCLYVISYFYKFIFISKNFYKNIPNSEYKNILFIASQFIPILCWGLPNLEQDRQG